MQAQPPWQYGHRHPGTGLHEPPASLRATPASGTQHGALPIWEFQTRNPDMESPIFGLVRAMLPSISEPFRANF
ncbi:hypothetical protein Cenrod_2130 [Candidatus Symbiobacter mobilis CR]|uniref:Uncharacterized protein n=1 Tax=Candidatus Symbiobacter mobilis CR TaxID=946483 RepID=U5NA53_9BURK|nr:hypothetical protein Cenrod_2130 [Candidatus Symbiobacter mobilis CR]